MLAGNTHPGQQNGHMRTAYVPPSWSSDLMDGPMLQVEGQSYKARLRIVIDEILRVDEAWIPIKARKLSSSQGAEVVCAYRIDPSSIQIGKEPSLIAGVDRVVVRDDDTGEKRVYGSAPFAPMLRGMGYGLLGLVAFLFCWWVIRRVRRAHPSDSGTASIRTSSNEW